VRCAVANLEPPLRKLRPAAHRVQYVPLTTLRGPCCARFRPVASGSSTSTSPCPAPHWPRALPLSANPWDLGLRRFFCWPWLHRIPAGMRAGAVAANRGAIYCSPHSRGLSLALPSLLHRSPLFAPLVFDCNLPLGRPVRGLASRRRRPLKSGASGVADRWPPARWAAVRGETHRPRPILLRGAPGCSTMCRQRPGPGPGHEPRAFCGVPWMPARKRKRKRTAPGPECR